MSLDYPFYERLCRLKHRAAWWWRIGDCLYYLGLLSAVVAVPGSVLALLAGLFGLGWRHLAATSLVFIAGAIVFVIGTSFKGYAHDLAERDGISTEF